MRIHPGGFRLVLVGAKVSRLLPFLQARGFLVEAFQKGGEAQARLRVAPCHVLIVELELGDMMGVELGRAARQDRHAGAVVLMDDPARSGMIVSALARGLETFLPIPPDENVFLERLETLLLAQWGLVVTQQQAQLLEDLNRAREATVAADERVLKAEAERDEARRKTEAQTQDARRKADEARRSVDEAVREARAALQVELAAERKKVDQLERETAVLRDQLTSMHLVTGAKTGVSEEGLAIDAEPPATNSTSKASAMSKPVRATVTKPSAAQTATMSRTPALDAVTRPAMPVVDVPRSEPAAASRDADGVRRANDIDFDDFATQTVPLPTHTPAPVVGTVGSTRAPSARAPAPTAAFVEPARSTQATTGGGAAADAVGGAGRRAPAPVSGTGKPVSPAKPPSPPATASAPPGATDGRAARNGVPDRLPRRDKPDDGDEELPTLKGARPRGAPAPQHTEDEATHSLAFGGADFDFPTTQVATPGPVARAPQSIFEDPTPLSGIKELGNSVGFLANDERTAPGGHSIAELRSALGESNKPAASTPTARPRTAPKPEQNLLDDLPELPSLDEEVLFLEDD